MFYAALVARMKAAGGRFIVTIDDGKLEALVGPGLRDPAVLMDFQGRYFRFMRDSLKD